MKSGVVPGGSAIVAVPPACRWDEPATAAAISASETASTTAATRPRRGMGRVIGNRPFFLLWRLEARHLCRHEIVQRVTGSTLHLWLGSTQTRPDPLLGLLQVLGQLLGGSPAIAGDQQLGDLAVPWDERRVELCRLDERERESELGVDDAEERADPLGADQLDEVLVERDVQRPDLLPVLRLRCGLRLLDEVEECGQRFLRRFGA